MGMLRWSLGNPCSVSGAWRRDGLVFARQTFERKGGSVIKMVGGIFIAVLFPKTMLHIVPLHLGV